MLNVGGVISFPGIKVSVLYQISSSSAVAGARPSAIASAATFAVPLFSPTQYDKLIVPAAYGLSGFSYTSTVTTTYNELSQSVAFFCFT